MNTAITETRQVGGSLMVAIPKSLRKALDLQKTVTDATNEMLRQTSSMMKEQAIAIEEQSQRGIVDLETLEQANRDLIDTLSGVLSTQEEGRQKRAMVEKRMDEMTQELRQALVQGRVT